MSADHPLGRSVPGLTLPAHTGEDVSLRERAAEGAILLVFVPYAFTPVCTSELRELAGLAPELRAAGSCPLVVSCDAKYALRAWAEQELGEAWDGVELLSDFWPHGRLARELGVFDGAHGGPYRTALLTDAAGVVVDAETAAFGTRRDLARFAARVD